jgi:hypothetical protein
VRPRRAPLDSPDPAHAGYAGKVARREPGRREAVRLPEEVVLVVLDFSSSKVIRFGTA